MDGGLDQGARATRFDGDPCPKGHGTARYVSGGDCVECNRLRALQSRATRRKDPRSAEQIDRERALYRIARQQARAAGKSSYLGLPCLHGHAGRRYVSSGQCVECRHERHHVHYRPTKPKVAKKARPEPAPPVQAVRIAGVPEGTADQRPKCYLGDSGFIARPSLAQMMGQR